jgi:TolA-binding protein
MNVADDCRSELLIGARRGRLSDAGRLALDAHLASCASCQMSREVSADFDGADAVDLHDGARIHALADRARAAVGSAGGAVSVGKAVRVGSVERGAGRSSGRASGRAPGRAPARLRAFAAAAALVILCGSASAAVWWMRRPPAARPVPAPTATAPAAERAVRPVRAATDVPAPAAPTTIPAPVTPVASVRQRPRPVLHAAVETRAGAVTPASFASATSLLQQATEARQRDERARAAELYRRLQHEFPASAEAVLSAVPLGSLLLADGLPRAALVEFDGYLAKAHGGALIPEALYGRARALGRLGDRAEERRTWTRLCADFPDSAYASLGRHRLAEIE